MSDDGPDDPPATDGASDPRGDDGAARTRRRWRWRGRVGLAARRARTKATRIHPRRTGATVGGVAVAVALMIAVTGVALGLASQTTVAGDDVDYWIAPDQGSATSLVVSTGGPQFGQVHETADEISAWSSVRYASPVQLEALRLRAADGGGESVETSEEFGDGTGGEASEHVLAVGVVGRPSLSVGGVSTSSLTAGDPHYANGTYTGDWTGEAALSPAAATLLDAEAGDRLAPAVEGADGRSFEVVSVEGEDASTGVGELPVVVVHLAELQALTGTARGDRADRLLVASNDRGIRDDLAAVYPRSAVLTRSGLTAQRVTEGLPLAIGLTALSVAVIVGTLFVATTMGLEVRTDRPRYAVMEAVGVSPVGRATVVTVQTLGVTVGGGVVGVALGFPAIVGVNAFARPYAGGRDVASAHPGLAVYGLLVAVAIAALATPYLLWQAKRTDVLADLGG